MCINSVSKVQCKIELSTYFIFKKKEKKTLRIKILPFFLTKNYVIKEEKNYA